MKKIREFLGVSANGATVYSSSGTIQQALGRSSIHPFPARMAPEIALSALGETTTSLRVLDPMAGSGTVLAVARAKGHRAYGLDLDPLAVLLSRTWTSSVNVKEVSEAASEVLMCATSQMTSGTPAYPPGADGETQNFIDFWFDERARQELSALSIAIEKIPSGRSQDVLWCAFSRLIITKSAGASLAMDLSHSRPHKVYSQSPIRPLERFLGAVDKVIKNCPQAGAKPVGPRTTVRHGDARKIWLADASIDLVVTSPPYLNAIDYMRCSKFSLVWMGYQIGEIRKIRGTSVGAEASVREASEASWIRALISELGLSPDLCNRDLGLLARYVWDMSLSLAEVSRVLRPGGRAVYVVGDSTVRGTFIPNSRITELVGQQAGLSLASCQSRQLPENRRYLPPPTSAGSGKKMGGRMRKEVVLIFEKPGKEGFLKGT